MFQWLTRLVWHDDFLREIIPGLTRREEQYHEEKKRRHEKEGRARLDRERYVRERARSDPFWARMESWRKRELLELELKDAEWILEYEKRLISLHKKVAAQRSRAEQTGTNTDRLRRLEHDLAGVRRSLD
jgi:hypothetical protein